MVDARTELSRDAIGDAAVGILETDGLDAVTGTRIATELGVTQPALYRHVDGMDDVWRELGLRGRDALAIALADAAVGRSGDEAVVAVAHAWRRFALDNPDLYAATDRLPCGGDDELEAAVEKVVDLLAMALRGYDLEPGAAIDAARLLRSFLHGFVHLELGDGHPHANETEASFDRIVHLLCAALPALTEEV